MKINWFSPLPPAKTDIANFTARVVPALSHHAEITLWTEQQDWDVAAVSCCDVRRFDPAVVPDLDDGINVFNSGNNVEFHLGIWRVMQRLSGVVILHDPVLFDFAAGLYLSLTRDIHALLTQIEFYYGTEGRAAGERFVHAAMRGRAEGLVEELVARCPMTPLALEHAQGVLTHSTGVADDISALAVLPVAYAPLAYAVSARPVVDAAPGHDTRLRLIVFGFIGPNRCIDKTLQAIASLPEPNAIRLDIYGELWDRQLVDEWIRDLHLEGTVTIHGYASEGELNEALQRSDFAINLRHPTRGEASGSQLRIFANRCASVVTRDGWYAGLGEDSVAFVEVGSEVTDLRKLLLDLLQDPDRLRSLGKNGFEKVIREHDPEKYTAALLDLIARCPSGEVDHRMSLRQAMLPADAGRAKDAELLQAKELLANGPSFSRNAKYVVPMMIRSVGGRFLRSRLIAPIFGRRALSWLKTRRK
jgi:glycosyltransferase involved in cell wall biosynthesis